MIVCNKLFVNESGMLLAALRSYFISEQRVALATYTLYAAMRSPGGFCIIEKRLALFYYTKNTRPLYNKGLWRTGLTERV